MANDGTVDSAPATVGIAVGGCSGVALPFLDDFESGRGWTVNPAGTDSATNGRWERANPQPTNDQGPKQLGDTPSGSLDLVTGAFAGSNASRYDIDGGVTSIRSPGVQLPTGQDITLALKYTFAHARNASSADYFRVRVVGATTATVLEIRGANTNVDAAWRSFSVSLNSFAGQTVYVLIEAADLGRDSLVEAAVDDVAITAAAPERALAGGELRRRRPWLRLRGRRVPRHGPARLRQRRLVASGGHSGGALQVSLGGMNGDRHGYVGRLVAGLHGRRGRPGERLLLVQAGPIAGLRGG